MYRLKILVYRDSVENTAHYHTPKEIIKHLRFHKEISNTHMA